MNLQSCNKCGLVYDVNCWMFPTEDDKYGQDNEIDDGKFTWDGDEYVPYIECSCGEYITKGE